MSSGCSSLSNGGIATAGLKLPMFSDYCLTIFITGMDEPDHDSGRFESD